MFKDNTLQRWGFRKLSQKVENILTDWSVDFDSKKRTNHSTYTINTGEESYLKLIVSFHPNISFIRVADDENDLFDMVSVPIEEVLDYEGTPAELMDAIIFNPEIFYKYCKSD